MTEKVYTIEIVRRRELDVMASSYKEAQEYARSMYESGDACAELDDPTFGVLYIRPCE